MRFFQQHVHTIPSYPCGNIITSALCLTHLSCPLLTNWSMIHCRSTKPSKNSVLLQSCAASVLDKKWCATAYLCGLNPELKKTLLYTCVASILNRNSVLFHTCVASRLNKKLYAIAYLCGFYPEYKWCAIPYLHGFYPE